MIVLVVGGFSRSLINFRGHLLQSMAAAGHEVHAAAPGLLADQTTASGLRAIGVTPHDVAIQRVGLNPLKDLGALASLLRLMREVGPDAVLAYTAKPVIWSMLAGALTGIPKRFALITGAGYAFGSATSGKRALISKIARSLYRYGLACASQVFFQNRDDAALFADLRLVPKSTPTAIFAGSGIDIERFMPQPLPAEPLSFLLIARLLGDKGIREYFSAAQMVSAVHPEVRFALVGPPDESPDGISRRELDAMLSRSIVQWHGETDDVRPFIAASHVYVLPSYREGTPRTVLEAMALGRAVITTDAPGCRETVVDGVNGFLVETQSAEAVARAMLRFIEAPELVDRMGREARRIAEERYDVRIVSRKMMDAMGL